MTCVGGHDCFAFPCPSFPPPRRNLRGRCRIAVWLCHDGVAADAPEGAINTRISRIVLGIGSDATEANLAWQSKTNETQFLEYWPTADPTNITRVESPRGPYNSAVFYPHEATMTGLEPDTEYAYRVGSDRRGYSEQRTFTTGTDGDSWSFLAMADAQIGVDTKIAEQSAAWNKAVNTATGEHPDSAFIMHLGDQVEGWVPRSSSLRSSPRQKNSRSTALPY